MFLPGQFITATRLNRLQPSTYWAQASASVNSGSGVDVPGTSMSIVVATAGAAAAFSWSGAVYATAAMTAGNIGLRPFWDVNGAPTYVVAQWMTASEKGSVANFWVTNVTTPGTYVFKLNGSVVANSSFAIYTSLMVQITEIA